MVLALAGHNTWPSLFKVLNNVLPGLNLVRQASVATNAHARMQYADMHER